MYIYDIYIYVYHICGIPHGSGYVYIYTKIQNFRFNPWNSPHCPTTSASGGMNTWPRAKLRVPHSAIKHTRRDGHVPQGKKCATVLQKVQNPENLIFHVLFILYGFLVFVYFFFSMFLLATFGYAHT